MVQELKSPKDYKMTKKVSERINNLFDTVSDFEITSENEENILLVLEELYFLSLDVSELNDKINQEIYNREVI